MEVKSLYIIKRASGVCLYHHDFGEPIFDPHLLSSFIVAMTSFFDEAALAGESKARAFEGVGYTLMVEPGEWTMGVLSVSHETAKLREKLRRIIKRFEEQFHVLKWVDMDLAVYSRFEPAVIDEFLRDQVHPDSVIRVKRDWEYFTRNPDVVALLNLIPKACTVQDAAKFLELPVEVVMEIVVEALWDRAVTVQSLPKPDAIYQATSFEDVSGSGQLSEETARALAELDGETPLSIVAERVKTSDIRRFLEEIELLAKSHKVERVPTGQALVVLYTYSLQDFLLRLARVVGYELARWVFFTAREQLLRERPWLGFVELEEDVDVEVRSSLVGAIVRGSISPSALRESLQSLLQGVALMTRGLIGRSPVKEIALGTKGAVEGHLPSMAIEVEWQKLYL